MEDRPREFAAPAGAFHPCATGWRNVKQRHLRIQAAPRSCVVDGFNSRHPAQRQRVMRAPLQGGSPQVVLQRPSIHNIPYARSPSKLCLLDFVEGSTAHFFTFDPEDGKMGDFASFQVTGEASWSLSRDGSQLALIRHCSERTVTFMVVSDKTTHEVEHNPWSSPEHRLGCRRKKRVRNKPDRKRSARDFGRGAKRQPSGAAGGRHCYPVLVGHSLARRALRRLGRSHRSEQRLDGGELLSYKLSRVKKGARVRLLPASPNLP